MSYQSGRVHFLPFLPWAEMTAIHTAFPAAGQMLEEVVEQMTDKDALPFAVVERVLLSLFLSSPSDAAALLSRFRYLQRMGFPSAKVGRGRKVAYGIEELLQLVLAFELLQVGVQPVRAARLVRTGWPGLREAFARSIASSKRSPVFVLFPHALDELSAGPDLQDQPAADPISVVERGLVARWLESLDSSSSCLVLDPARISARVRAALDEARGDPLPVTTMLEHFVAHVLPTNVG